MDNMSYPHINLDSMPILVLHSVVSHLDIGHVISLTQVNRQLCCSLTNDNGYLVSLIRIRLNIKLTGDRRNNAFLELVRGLPTLRCDECHEMQFPWRPFVYSFWNRGLCDACRNDDKYRLITAYTVKKNYFLDENDLLLLWTFSGKNPHYENASHVRFFSWVAVQRRSESKLQLLGTTRIDRLKKRNLRSYRAKACWVKRVAERREHIVQLLTANGFPYASVHYCTAVHGFVRNLVKGHHASGVRWRAEDVIQICCTGHMR